MLAKPDRAPVGAALAADLVLRTPVRRLLWLERSIGRPVWVKLENEQVSGSFKVRGALSALSTIPVHVPVVAASAGNHALGLAAAAAVTGHRLTLCLPFTASQAKRERLAAYPVSLIEHGATVDASSRHARRLARERGWRFVSPYDDPAVIAGQGTAVSEFIDQVGGLGTLVVPVGGGGLLSGAVAVADGVLQIIGCQPEVFPVLKEFVTSGRLDPRPYRPGLADGLMVNVERGSRTLAAAQHERVRLVTVSEEDLAAAVVLLLNRESILVEPSGAAGLAALLAGIGDLPPGPVGIMLTGGNMTTANLMRVLTWPFCSPHLVRWLDLSGRDAEDEPVYMPTPPATQSRYGPTVESRRRRFEAARESATAATEGWAAFERRSRDEGLSLTDEERSLFLAHADVLSTLVESLDRRTSAHATDHSTERIERLVYQHTAFLAGFSGWQSESYNQSIVPAFRRVSAQGSPRANYARYGSDALVEVEAATAGTLGLDASGATILATSSGMAAFSLIEAWLLRYGMEAGAHILASPDIYFEAAEQIRSLRGFHVHWVRACDTDAFLAAIEQYQPAAIFADALANTIDLRLAELQVILTEAPRLLRQRCTLVIDGTTLSGGFDPFAWRSDDRIDVFYYESGSKYLQLGLDLALVGVVATDPRYRASLQRLRRNLGSVLYDQQCHLIPRVSRDDYLERMRRLTESAGVVAARLAELDRASGGRLVDARFPGLSAHPDCDRAPAYRHLGGLVSLVLRNEGFGHPHALAGLIDRVLSAAQARRIPLVKGVSFGFSVPRLSAANASDTRARPFLRLSAGDVDANEALGLADVLADTISRYQEDAARWAG